MMRLIAIISCLLWNGVSSAQQAAQFTQFLEAKTFFNPGYLSEDNVLSITGRHRDQWSALEGGPTGQTIMVEFPRISNAIGFGLVLNRETIGIQEKNDIAGIYAYNLQLSKAQLSLGLQFSYRQFINDFTKDGLIAINGFDLDPSLDRIRFSTNVFNLGFGLSLRGEKYHIGISAPRMVRSKIGLPSAEAGSVEARQFYGLLGFDFTLNQLWDFEPGMLLKFSENAPFDADFQGNFIYNDQVHMGLNIRAGGTQSSLFESLAVLIGFDFTKTVFASMSYDFTTSEIREFENGSFELLVRYRAFKDSSPKSIQNPRYY